MQAVRLGGQFGMLAIHRQRVLGQIVGANREEIHQRRETVGHHRHRRNLDHDAELDFGAFDLLAGEFTVAAQGFDFADVGDHREHDPQRAVLGGAVERPQLGVQQILPLQQQPRTAHAEEGIFLARQIEIGHLLVAADVQRANDQPATGHDVDHLAINLILLLFVRRGVAFQEQELGAHQADALGPGFDCRRRLFGVGDVGGDFDGVAVGGGRRQMAGRAQTLAGGGLAGDHFGDAALVGFAHVQIQNASPAIHDRNAAFRDRQQSRTRRHDGGQPEGAGQNRGMRSGAAGAGRQAHHMAGIEMQGVGRGEIVRRQDRGFGQRELLPFDAEQLSQHPLADIAQIDRAGRQQRIVHLLELVDPRPQRPLPGPGGPMTLHDRDQRVPRQHRIGQQFALSGENGGLGGAEPLPGAPFQFLALGADCDERLFQRLALGDHVARLVGNLEALGNMAHQLADRQAGTGAQAVQGARRATRRPLGRGFPRGQGVAAGALGIGLFHGGQPTHRIVQGIQRALRVGTTGGEPQGRTTGDAERQQVGQGLGIGELGVLVNPQFTREPLGGFDPAGGRAGVQPIRIIHGPGRLGIGGPRRRGCRFRRGGRGRSVAQGRHQHQRVVGVNQRLERLGLLHQPGQPAQQADVFVRLGGNRHDQIDRLTFVPRQPGGYLQDGDAGVMDQVAVVNHPVRNGDPAAEEGVRHLLALEQALDVAGFDVAGVRQQLARETDRFFLGGDPRVQTDTGASNRFHKNSDSGGRTYRISFVNDYIKAVKRNRGC